MTKEESFCNRWLHRSSATTRSQLCKRGGKNAKPSRSKSRDSKLSQKRKCVRVEEKRRAAKLNKVPGDQLPKQRTTDTGSCNLANKKAQSGVCDKHRHLILKSSTGSNSKITQRLWAGDHKNEVTKFPSRSSGSSPIRPISLTKDCFGGIPFALAISVHNPVGREPAKASQKRDQKKGVKIAATPESCRIKVVKFQKAEIIEELDPEMEEKRKSILQIIHKSRRIQEPSKKVDLARESDTPVTRLLLAQVAHEWAESRRQLKTNGSHQEPVPLEIINYEEPVGAATPTPTPTSTPSTQKPQTSLARNAKSLTKNSLDMVLLDKGENSKIRDQSEKIQQYLTKKGPAYQETITTQLRYNFQRKKRFYSMYLMQHVLQYNRPPFWNYTRKYGGFNVLLSKYQLEHLYELVPMS